MKRTIPLLLLIGLISFMVGCMRLGDTTKEAPTMADIYDEHFSTVDERSHVQKPPTFPDLSSLRLQKERELAEDFELLDNPMLLIYVFPHLATDERMPVPGYWTAIPLYERDEFALPGENYRVRFGD
ncbi:MAG: hypothetical protein F4039_07845 [Gammaproteobacteria bacterium]|nr:hypothetical protein [Gammaproteobacteria bacterium]MYF52900.1 hypothetical protein [Gammaproteobacteria bacterium]MYK43982.1 hypothetical protein [Gammaproteobacteria bacterium]